MEAFKVPLLNPSQVRFFVDLRKHRLPRNFRSLLQTNEAGDFLQALLKHRVECQADGWSVDALIQLRRQLRVMNAAQMASYVRRVVYRSRAMAPAALLPFSCSSHELQDAARIYERIGEICSDPEILTNGNMPIMTAMINLITWDGVLKTWGLLCRGVQAGDALSLAGFRKILLFGAIINWHPRFVPVTQFARQYETMSSEEISNLILSIEAEPGETSETPVPDDTVHACMHVLRVFARSSEKPYRAMARLVEWFAANLDEFQEEANRYWQEMLSDPKYGLRPNGDVVSISVPTLKLTRYRHLQLIPLPEFPSCKVRYWVDLDGGQRLIIPMELTGPSLASPHPSSGEFDQVIDSLQAFIAIHSLWKIVTGNVFTRRKSAGKKRAPSADPGRRRSFLVRPHFRWLPPGFRPTERALARAEETWPLAPVPAGKTFVMSDADLAQVVALSSQAPTFAYTEADLGYEEDPGCHEQS